MNRPQGKVRKPRLLYVLGCEGANQETLYFEKVKEIVNNIPERTKDVEFLYAEPYGGNPKCVVERTIQKSIGKSNKASIFDYDAQKDKYEEAIDLGVENGIELGYSNYCFDLWLILHKEDFSSSVGSQDEYASDVRRIYGLRSEVNIKKKKYVEKIVEQITFDDIKAAILRADSIVENNKKKECKITPKGNRYFENPDTMVHNVLRKIFAKSGVEI